MMKMKNTMMAAVVTASALMGVNAAQANDKMVTFGVASATQDLSVAGGSTSTSGTGVYVDWAKQKNVRLG